MLISDFNYELPEDLIAQNPLRKRDQSRMLIADRAGKTMLDRSFSDFPSMLNKGDVVVLNNTSVFPARLSGKTETGGKIELFLVVNLGEGIWEALARPGKRLKAGKKMFFHERLSAEVIGKQTDGKITVEFDFEGDFEQILDEIGQTPLPPYIKRPDEKTDRDRQRYQTVYAKKCGAIAAPTAGLHFTPDTLDEIKNRGVEIAEITLHVGYGTFEPVRGEDLSKHRVTAENFEIPEDASDKLNRAKAGAGRIVAIGTTTTRALESCLLRNRVFVPGKQTADLTITPGYRFQAIDCLLTNFHLPKSSLLVLVSTFGGYDFIMDCYRHAVDEKYRFYSYGDCMFLS